MEKRAGICNLLINQGWTNKKATKGSIKTPITKVAQEKGILYRVEKKVAFLGVSSKLGEVKGVEEKTGLNFSAKRLQRGNLLGNSKIRSGSKRGWAKRRMLSRG